MSFKRTFSRAEYSLDPPYPEGTKCKWSNQELSLRKKEYCNTPDVLRWDWGGLIPCPELCGSSAEVEILEGETPLTPTEGRVYPVSVLKATTLPDGLKEGDRVSFDHNGIKYGKLVYAETQRHWYIEAGAGWWAGNCGVTEFWVGHGNRGESPNPQERIVAPSRDICFAEDLMNNLPPGISEGDMVEFSTRASSGRVGMVGLTPKPSTSVYKYSICDDHGSVYNVSVTSWKLRDTKVVSRLVKTVCEADERNPMPNVRVVSTARIVNAVPATPSTNFVPETEMVVLGPTLRNFEPVLGPNGTPTAVTTAQAHNVLLAEAIKHPSFKDVDPTNIRTYVGEPLNIAAR